MVTNDICIFMPAKNSPENEKLTILNWIDNKKQPSHKGEAMRMRHHETITKMRKTVKHSGKKEDVHK
jgi:hypothetical protein